MPRGISTGIDATSIRQYLRALYAKTGEVERAAEMQQQRKKLEQKGGE